MSNTSKPIDRVKLQQDIVGAVSNAAQRFLDATSDSQRQKAAGAINGLADMLDDIFSIAGDGELRAAFQGDMLQDQRLADDADTAASVRYHTAAANEISAVIQMMDTWTEVKEAKAEYDAVMKKYEAPAPVIANEIVGHEDEPVEQGTVEEAPLEIPAQPAKRPFIERVPITDVLVWSYCRTEQDGPDIPVEDLMINFYLKGGRSDRKAKSAAMNAVYGLKSRKWATFQVEKIDGVGHGHPVMTTYRLTPSGLSEASHNMAPEVKPEEKSEEELLEEYGHLKEEVGDAQV